MSAKFNNLYEFVDRAKRNRKYPENTAVSLKAALNLYQPELNDDEQNSLEKFEENFNQISQNVFRKNANEFSASSLATYKSRVLKVLTDYKRYGDDPIKMNSWSPRVINRAKKTSSLAEKTEEENQKESEALPGKISGNVHKIELSLRPDTKVVI